MRRGKSSFNGMRFTCCL